MKALRITIIFIILAIQVSACVDSSQAVLSELESTTWVLNTLNNNRPIDGTKLTIQFEDGQISGSAGCNSYGGSYQIKGDAISFSPLFSTEMACMDPEAIMEQERTYLELLQSATRFELVDGVLTIFVGESPSLIFEMQTDSPALPTSTLIPSSPIPITATATLDFIEPTQTPTFEPPAGHKEYRDSVAGISIYIPENWNVTGVINGQYAIFQSYYEDKYVGGEAHEAGDTKCDLNIRPPGTNAGELIQQWESNPRTTIVSDEEIILKSGLIGRRLVLESMGRSVALVAEINRRAVVLTCFGNSEPFEDIAKTLSGFEAATLSPIYESVEGFKQYQDTETGVTLDMPERWIATGIIPGQRVTLQSYPENKYVGGEALEPGDTKCDLFIRNDISAKDFINQMRSNEAITIITEDEISLITGQTGTRVELNSLGRSISVITEINGSTVVLTCYGDLSPVDAIAITLKDGQ
jgi:heat shock protein HslJ